MKISITLILTIMLLTACGSSKVSQKQVLTSDSNKAATKVASTEESQTPLSLSSSSSFDDSTHIESPTGKTSESVPDTEKEKGVLGIAFVEVTSDENEAYGTPIGLYIVCTYP